MSDVKKVIRTLAKYAIAKQGAKQCHYFSDAWTLKYPNIALRHARWGEFFDVSDGESVARIPVLKEAFHRHQTNYPAITESRWVERDGHVYMDVPLDAGLPLRFLKSVIDDAYQIVWNKLDDHGRQMIELGSQPYDEQRLLGSLIKYHGLTKHQVPIKRLVQKAVLLRTKPSMENRIPVGATKIGGRPDLPIEVAWPVFSDGKPLAFLAQINLAEIARVGNPIKGLPSEGLLSVFSVWGWMTEDCGDPLIPNNGWSDQENHNWTVCVFTPAAEELIRRRTPRSVNAFKAAAVEPIEMMTLPNHRAEVPRERFGWADDDYERFDSMQSDLRTLQMGHILKVYDSFASHHQLGGYPVFQQEYPEVLRSKDLAMFLQIGTDDHTKMSWGDGGELTFYADLKTIAKGCIERIWGDCQGG